MKAFVATAAFAAGLAAAASTDPAEVFLVRPQPSGASHHDSTPQLPPQIARHVLFQRLSGRYDAVLDDLPDSYDAERAVDEINEFGKQPMPLFSGRDAGDVRASQLVLLLEGATGHHTKPLKQALKDAHFDTYFTVPEPPSAEANAVLLADAQNVAPTSSADCDLAGLLNPYDSDCWNGLSSVARFDLQKKPDTISQLVERLPALAKEVDAKNIEVAIVMMPESSRKSKVAAWSPNHASAGQRQHRARGFESVLSAGQENLPDHQSFVTSTNPSDKEEGPHAPLLSGADYRALPSCFSSETSCTNETNACSGHGSCINIYGEGSEPACFACRCKATLNHPEDSDRPRSTTKWGGKACQRQDISVPFWLLTGFAIVLTGTVAFCISLLFSVGEEKLPGVIGAGVSRSK